MGKKNKIIEDRIIHKILVDFAEEDLDYIKKRRDRQLIYLATGYFPIVLILMYVLFQGTSLLHIDESKMMDEKLVRKIEVLRTVIPYTIGFFFVLLTVYFIHYFFQTALPLIRDVKQKQKMLFYYMPEKTEMSIFHRYFLSTPIYKKQQVEITQEDFHAIPPNHPLILEMSPNSLIILRFRLENREIQVK